MSPYTYPAVAAKLAMGMVSLLGALEVRADSPAVPQLMWKKTASGLVTDVAVSRDGSVSFLATIPDLERGAGTGQAGAQKDYRVQRWDAQGRMLWSQKTEGQVKSIALSPSGVVALYSDYRDELTALSASGRVLWKREHAPCRPYVLESLGQVLCYHDDDAQPRIAYQLFDLQSGARRGDFPIQTDVLALRVARDEKSWVLAVTAPNPGAAASAQGSRVIWVDGVTSKIIAQTEVEGEVIDLGVLPGRSPSFAALVWAGAQGQKVQVWNAKKPRTLSVAGSWTQLEVASSGRRIYLYGNSLAGQQVAAIDVEPAPSAKGPQLAWIKREGNGADYSSSVLSAGPGVITGWERKSPQGRENFYTFFGESGQEGWRIDWAADRGSYLYAQALSESGRYFLVATDDAQVGLYVLP